MTKREQVLMALHGAISDVPPVGVQVLRNAVLPERLPDGGLLILRDGMPGEPEVTLSPRCYHWEHRAEIEVIARDSRQGEAVFDSLCAYLGRVIDADRTLGGLCDWIELSAPAPVDLPIDGAAPIRAAVIDVTLNYTSDGPLA